MFGTALSRAPRLQAHGLLQALLADAACDDMLAALAADPPPDLEAAAAAAEAGSLPGGCPCRWRWGFAQECIWPGQTADLLLTWRKSAYGQDKLLTCC